MFGGLKYSLYLYIRNQQTMTMYNKETIQEKLRTDIRWMIRTLEILFDRQTNDEQETKQTRHVNGRGFNGMDSEILTSFYNQIQKRKQSHNPILLSEGQIRVCKKVLPKYWKQVQSEIEKKGNN